jgi:hypothetical protein
MSASSTTSELSPVQLCALGGAVKSKQLTDAKASLAEGSTHAVDFVARIRGNVTKAISEPPSTGTAPAQADLFQRGVMLDLLRRLKVTPQQVRTALRAATKPIEESGQLSTLGQGVIAQDLAAAIEQVQEELSGRLPAQPWNRPGRAGAVTSQITVDPLSDEQPRRKAA